MAWHHLPWLLALRCEFAQRADLVLFPRRFVGNIPAKDITLNVEGESIGSVKAEMKQIESETPTASQAT